MLKRLPVIVLPLLALAACVTASAEERLRRGLIDAGISPRVAGCMAERMVDRLSIAQLKRLQSLSSLKDERIEEMTVAQFLHKVRAFRDPELLEVTTRAGLGCAIAG